MEVRGGASGEQGGVEQKFIKHNKQLALNPVCEHPLMAVGVWLGP